MNAGRKPWLPAATAAAFAFALYAITLGGTYVYDDFDILFNDARLRNPEQWKLYWTQSYNGGVDNLYRPLVSMTYAIQWWLHGDRAWAFHLVNILMHAGVCALVAELARRLLSPSPGTPGEGRGEGSVPNPRESNFQKNPHPTLSRNTGRGSQVAAAYVAGLLFAALPIHVEAVANIVGRAELMCALGAVGAMVLMLRRPMTIPRAIAITGCFLVALLSKEQGMLVPLLLLILWFCTRWQPQAEARDNLTSTPGALEYADASLARRDESQRRAWLILILMLCWGLAGYIVLRERILKFWWDRSFLDRTIQPMILSTGKDRWLLPVLLLGRYAALLGFPWKLSPDYGGKVIGSVVRFDDPYFFIGIAIAGLWLIATVWAAFRRRGVTLFCLLGFGITYLLVGNILTIIGTNFGERLMYLPSVFFVLLIALLASRISNRVLIPIAAIVIVAASVRTFTYARRWNDRLNFYQTCLAEQPRSIRLHMLVAAELMSQNRLDEAAEAAARGRELMPDYNEIWIQSGVIALEQGKLDQADEFLDHALQLKPNLKGTGWKDKVAKRRAEMIKPPK